MTDAGYAALANRDYVEALYARWNDGDMAGFYDMLSEDVVDASAGEGEVGRTGVQRVLDEVRTAMPDARYEVLDVLTEGDGTAGTRFVAMLRVTGTQTGSLFGEPATGRTASWAEWRACRRSPGSGRTVEHVSVLDSLGMWSQLGHVRAPGRGTW